MNLKSKYRAFYAQNALAAYNPLVVGKWDMQGAKIGDIENLSAYISMLPNKYDFIENQFVQVAHTVAVDVSGWDGWAQRMFN